MKLTSDEIPPIRDTGYEPKLVQSREISFTKGRV